MCVYTKYVQNRRGTTTKRERRKKYIIILVNRVWLEGCDHEWKNREGTGWKESGRRGNGMRVEDSTSLFSSNFFPLSSHFLPAFCSSYSRVESIFTDYEKGEINELSVLPLQPDLWSLGRQKLDRTSEQSLHIHIVVLLPKTRIYTMKVFYMAGVLVLRWRMKVFATFSVVNGWEGLTITCTNRGWIAFAGLSS